MPFTFSHPAIILPLKLLKQSWFSLTGLIIGSLTPDFEYFIRMKVQSDYSHTIGGIFLFDLPLGILLAFLFHNVIRNTLYDNLPWILKSRIIEFKQFNWTKYFRENWIVVIISILIGAISHIFWDSFTHSTGYFVELIPQLKYSINLAGKEIYIYKILQHTSSLIGGIIIAGSIYRLPKNTLINESLNLNYWIILTILVLVVMSIKLLISDNIQIGNLIVSVISAIIIGLILTPLIFVNKNNAS
mgnify:CR=1 FL=1